MRLGFGLANPNPNPNPNYLGASCVNIKPLVRSYNNPICVSISPFLQGLYGYSVLTELLLPCLALHHLGIYSLRGIFYPEFEANWGGELQ